MSELDGFAWLEDVKTKWLRQCASCDAGLMASCACSTEDYRPAMLRLVETVERLSRRCALRFQETQMLATERDAYRAVVDAARAWRDWRREWINSQVDWSDENTRPVVRDLAAAVDALPPDGPGNGPQIAVEATGGPETDPRTRDPIASERRTEALADEEARMWGEHG